MLDKKPRLFIGPMSKEIVNSVTEFSKSTGKPLGLIPSRRQIEFDGGYVNNWTTKEFSVYTKKQNKDVLLVRDHAGPGQGNVLDDGIESLSADIDAEFDILHIDPWKTVKSIKEGIEKTSKLILECNSRDKNILYEIGTEEAIYPYTPEQLDQIIIETKKSIGDVSKNIAYGVVQSGVQISGTKNIGNFNPSRLKRMTDICKSHGLISKEHNGDYLTLEEIKSRVSQGLDCINIAPEFGVIQTKLLMEHAFSKKQKEEAFKVCKESKKYIKWLPADMKLDPPNDMVINVSGHYSFTKEPFVSSIPLIQLQLRHVLFKRFEEIISCWE